MSDYKKNSKERYIIELNGGQLLELPKGYNEWVIDKTREMGLEMTLTIFMRAYYRRKKTINDIDAVYCLTDTGHILCAWKTKGKNLGVYFGHQATRVGVVKVPFSHPAVPGSRKEMTFVLALGQRINGCFVSGQLSYFLHYFMES